MCPQKLFERLKGKQESLNARFVDANHNGEDDSEVRLINQTDNVEELEEGNLFGNMTGILFSLMDLIRVKWLFFDIETYLLFFVILTHNICFGRWQ